MMAPPGTLAPSRQWPEYLLAILLGNVIFLGVSPFLPAALQHEVFRVDLGLAVDFLTCLGVYGAIRWFKRR